MLPVMELTLAPFPFEICGFHADYGKEYVNHRVAQMPDKLNANIPQRHVGRFNVHCREYLNPFLSFHRPCLFTTDKVDPKKPGRIKKV